VRRRPKARFLDLSKVIIGAMTDKPSQTGRRVPEVRVPVKSKYRGQCPTCGGAKVVESPIPGITWLCPYCTGYQGCGQ
jgi:hypothetical protein